MKLIVGLGNPGKGYEETRHNIGFLIIDRLVKKAGLKYSKSASYLVAQRGEIALLKPMTFMNRSGIAVDTFMKKKSVSTTLLVYDDVYIPLGEIRVREKGSNGGHNGVKSVIDFIGESWFCRLRIGVGTPSAGQLSDYVLDKFDETEALLVDQVVKMSIELIEKYIEDDYSEMLKHYSRVKNSYSDRISEIRSHQTKGGN